MTYGIIRLELDDFSALNPCWVADVESIRLFRHKAMRDRVLDELEDGCESYEMYVPFDRAVNGDYPWQLTIKSRYEVKKREG